MRLIGVVKLGRSPQYPCSEAYITFISKPHDDDAALILAPYRGSGADPIEGRKGFEVVLDRVENNGVRTVIVEDASRFAASSSSKSLASPCWLSAMSGYSRRPATT